MKFTATLAAATLAASASASQQQDVAKAASQAIRASKQQLKTVQAAQNAKTLSSLKEFKLANKGVALGAQGVSKRSARALRGKGGKGKGKDKDDGDDTDGTDRDSAEPTRFLQLATGICAGMDLGGEPLAEDLLLNYLQFKSGVCADGINSDGFGFSYMMSAAAEPFSITRKSFDQHGCMAEYFMAESDETSDFLFGGVAADGMCHDTGMGFGMLLGVSETSISAPAAGAVMSGGSSNLGDCRSAGMSGSIGMYDEVDVEMTTLTFAGSTFPVCNSMDDFDDDAGGDDAGGDDAGADDAGAGGSYSYDTSSCGGETPSLTINIFSDDDCTVPVGSSVEEPKFCYFDYHYFADDIAHEGASDFFYDVQTCYP